MNCAIHDIYLYNPLTIGLICPFVSARKQKKLKIVYKSEHKLDRYFHDKLAFLVALNLIVYVYRPTIEFW